MLLGSLLFSYCIIVVCCQVLGYDFFILFWEPCQVVWYFRCHSQLDACDHLPGATVGLCPAGIQRSQMQSCVASALIFIFFWVSTSHFWQCSKYLMWYQKSKLDQLYFF